MARMRVRESDSVSANAVVDWADDERWNRENEQGKRNDAAMALVGIRRRRCEMTTGPRDLQRG